MTMPILTPNQRLCYDLYYNEHRTQAEIAELIGISQPAVSKNLHRALAVIKGPRPREITMPKEQIDQLDMRRVAVL